MGCICQVSFDGSTPDGTDRSEMVTDPPRRIVQRMDSDHMNDTTGSMEPSICASPGDLSSTPAATRTTPTVPPTEPSSSTVVAAPPKPKSFYRRELPAKCIGFASPRGREIFTQALTSEPNFMQIYFPLAQQFTTQTEPSFCGLATLAMCLNALEIDPGRGWKGVWRWFSEELFDCCTSLDEAKARGISFPEFVCLARCNGVQTQSIRADQNLSLEDFRAIVKRCCSSSDEILVLNYSRKVLHQTGDGHFSPIGGYHPQEDLVLLLDVARFKYPPHWVPLQMAFEAMRRVDVSSGLPRGLVAMRTNDSNGISCCQKLSTRTECRCQSTNWTNFDDLHRSCC